MMRPRAGHHGQMTSPASGSFEIETAVVGRHRNWGLKALASLMVALDGSADSWPGSEPKLHLTISEKRTGRVLFEDPSADADVAQLAATDLATLSDEEFRQRWQIGR